MIPSNDTVVRFIAYYGYGTTVPMSQLVLGHGFQGEGGLAHDILLKFYFDKERHGLDKELFFAGYMYVENNEVLILDEGGSITLWIPSSKDRSRDLLDNLKHLRGMRSVIINLFPLITRRVVEHLMLAQQ